VVFDEFTAHLDPTTERDIVDAMRRITDGRTTLIIAHRGATLSLADRVFVLDGDLRAGIRP
jgi:ABC-type multidrug transport system fused ATPase/permease subunit